MGRDLRICPAAAGRNWFLPRFVPAALLLAVACGSVDRRAVFAASPCVPTRGDIEGPFYTAGAPLTTSTGAGLTVAGRVLGAPDCRPVPGARIEWWQTNRNGRYDDAHRGSQVSDSDGNYRFTTDFPGVYPGRPPHIHFKAFAPGYRPLTTQLYLRGGEEEVSFPIVLAPR